ncbi:MAG: outer membrane lipoprotein carrier protein LolA [Thermoanaerobaculia bacterium]|nr:outer membrane lipoprotein carrier protein LolA [Thermoanaerobaculia bacterium]
MPRSLPALLLAVLTPAAALAGDALPDPLGPGVTAAERLDLLVERVRLEQSKTVTLEADFVQRKQSEMLLEPLEARGSFSYAAPDRVRWEYETPDPISLLVIDGEMTTWYRDLGQAEKISVGRQAEKILDFLGAGSNVETLLTYFDAHLAHTPETDAPFRLELIPRFDRVERRLREMTIWIDSRRFLPIAVRYVEPNGDVTEYEFSNLRINDGLPADRFELDLPQGVALEEIALERRSTLR